MRARTEQLSRITRDERGAVLIVVAVFSLVAVIFLAVVVDLGGLRAERKEVTTSTDAAALAGVQVIDFTLAVAGEDLPCSTVLSTEGTLLDPKTVEDTVNEYLERNGESDSEACTVTITNPLNGEAYVTVGGSDVVDFAFGGATGVDEGRTDGVSSAAIESDGGGLRPFGMCVGTVSLRENSDEPVSEDNPVYVLPPSDAALPERISLVADAENDAAGNGRLDGHEGSEDGRPDVFFPIDKLDESSPCGDAPGNFGQLDLADNNGSNAPGNCNDPPDDDKLCDNTVNGYDEDVSSPISGSTGNNYNPFDGPFEDLEDDGTQFWVPVYDAFVDGRGNNAEFIVRYWMEVQPLDHCFKEQKCGKPAFDDDDKRWFKWKVLRIIDYLEWPVGPPLTGDAVQFAPRLCAFDDSDTSYCER